MKPRTLLIVFGLLLAAAQSRGALQGFFLGLDGTIEHSDVVVVAEITRALEPDKTRFHGTIAGGLPAADYKVHVLMTLKGEIEGDYVVAKLRPMPAYHCKPPRVLKNNAIRMFIGQHIGPRLGDRYVLFLREDADEQGRTYLYNMSNSGTTMRIAPDSDLSELTGKPAVVVIRALLKDYVRYRRRGLKLMEAKIDAIVGDSAAEALGEAPATSGHAACIALCAAMAGLGVAAAGLLWRRARAAR